MKVKKVLSFLLACMLAFGYHVIPAGAITAPDADTQAITRVTGQIKATISANKITPLGDSVPLDRGEIVTFNFTYTPKCASVKFGFIAPDGYFYGLSGSNGSINKGIRVSEPGSYQLAIKNNSSEAVAVTGTLNY